MTRQDALEIVTTAALKRADAIANMPRHRLADEVEEEESIRAAVETLTSSPERARVLVTVDGAGCIRAVGPFAHADAAETAKCEADDESLAAIDVVTLEDPDDDGDIGPASEALDFLNSGGH